MSNSWSVQSITRCGLALLSLKLLLLNIKVKKTKKKLLLKPKKTASDALEVSNYNVIYYKFW